MKAIIAINSVFSRHNVSNNLTYKHYALIFHRIYMAFYPNFCREPMKEIKFSYPQLAEVQCKQFDRFAEILIEQNKIHNLIAAADLAEIHKRHFADSLAAMPILEELQRQADRPLSLIDIGSGAGFPGLALAIAFPDWQITSVEATGKKVRFQQSVIDSLGIANARAIHGRSEEIGKDPAYREKFDVATARALADMNMLAELTLPLIKVGGTFLAWKGPSVVEELNNAKNAIKTLGGKQAGITNYKLDTDHNFAIANIKKTAPTPKKYPRQYKTIKRSPLK